MRLARNFGESIAPEGIRVKARQMDAMERAEQIAALEGFVADNVDLERLKGLLVETDAAALKTLRNFESLAANDSDFEKLKQLHEQWSTKFDAIEFLGRSRDELFHSRFLAWLLDPKGKHETGTYFLENFLRKTLEQAKALAIGKAASPEIEEADWTETHVQLEWHHKADGHPGFLDILLVNKGEKFLCAIENKVFSSEHSGQLRRYRTALDKKFPEDFTRHYVFLSPGGMPPEQKEEQKHWVPETYATILELVEDTLEKTAATMREDIRVFLRQYATTLRRNIVPEHPKEVRELARKIYLENREVIELIYRHKPDYLEEMKEILRDVVRKHPHLGWCPDKDDKRIIRFRPKDWEKLPGFQTGIGWSPSKSLLLFEFLLLDIKNVYMVLCLGPGKNEAIRRKTFEKINDVYRNPFEHTNDLSYLTSFSDKYVHIYSGKRILGEEDLCKWDDEERSYIREKVGGWVAGFAQDDFPRINEVIVKCFKD